MAQYLVLSFSLGGIVVGGWAFFYGFSAGIRKRRILADHEGNYDEGRRAVIRGLVYCIVGALIAGPCLALWVQFLAGVLQG